MMGLYIDNFCEQWASILAARMCIASKKSSEELESAIRKNQKQSSISDSALKAGIQMSRNYTLAQLSLMKESIENLIIQFLGEEYFPKLFSAIFGYADNVLSSITDKSSRTNEALHTDKIMQEEKLSELDQLICETFVYLSSLIDAAVATENKDATIAKIDVSLIESIFKYLDHSLPNQVRASAGKILCSLSASFEHCQALVNIFWKKFSLCKRDNDFRNFASLIDGIQDIQLSLATPELTTVAINFLNNFTSNVKKVERGVLRMKFLSAMNSIIEKLSKFFTNGKIDNEELGKVINSIWNIVIKWSSKAKHTVFCLEFLVKVIITLPPQFFLSDHGSPLFSLIFKAINSMKCDLELLKILQVLIDGLPKEYYDARFDIFKDMIEKELLPTLFKVSPTHIIPKYKTNEQIDWYVEIFVSIGKKKFLPIVDFCRNVFKEADPSESKLQRLICIRVLGKLSQTAPHIFEHFNDELYQYIQPMLLKKTPNQEETNYALLTFPLLHSPDSSVIEENAKVIFDVGVNEKEIDSNAYKSIIQYIHKFIDLHQNPSTILYFCNELTNAIYTLPENEILFKLHYLNGVLIAFNKALEIYQNEEDIIQKFDGTFHREDWVDFRIKTDANLLALLLSPDTKILNKVKEVEAIFLNGALLKLDNSCLPSPVFMVCHLLSQQMKIDFIKMLPVLSKSDPSIINKMFEILFMNWKENSSKLNEQSNNKFLQLLCSLLRPNCQASYLNMFLDQIFELILKNPDSHPIYRAIELIIPHLWISVLEELESWMKNSNHSISVCYTQYTYILYSFVHNLFYISENEMPNTYKSLNELLQDNEKLNEKINSYISALYLEKLKIDDKVYFNTMETTMKIIILYASSSSSNFSQFFCSSPDTYEKLINSLRDMIRFESEAEFPPNYMETYIQSLEVIFSSTNFTNSSIIDSLLAWLEIFSHKTTHNEQLQSMIVKVLEIILEKNPTFLESYFKNSVSEVEIFSSQLILAISNVYARLYEKGEQFDIKFKDGNAYALATVLLHLRNDNAMPRQAAHKLMCILLTKSNKSAVPIFPNEVPIYLMMALTSHSAAGYVTQSSHFVNYSSKNTTPSIAAKIFNIFAANFNLMKPFQKHLILMLSSFMELFVKEYSAENAVQTLLKLTSQSDISNIEISDNISILWNKYFSFVNENIQKAVISAIFSFASSQTDLKSNETLAAINVLVYAFQEAPDATFQVVFAPLEKYNKKTPSDYESFVQLVSKPTVDFSVTKEEIISSNVLSQVILSIKSREDFQKLIVPNLAPLMFFASMMNDRDEFAITSFHPLIDSILETSLFRFAETHHIYTNNLKSLQEANLLLRASSLDEQYEIFSEAPAKHILAYDRNAVRTYTLLLCQIDPNFKKNFFEIILANTFMVTDNERTMEPFLMLVSVIDEFDIHNLFSMMLFSLIAYKNNRPDIVDPIIDIVKEIMLNEDNSDENFVREAATILSCLIQFLSLKCKRSLSIHIVKVIYEICTRALSLSASLKEKISNELFAFISQFGGEVYVAGLFAKFVAEINTLGDASIDNIIECLVEISKLISITSFEQYNWCSIFALVLDGYRHFLAVSAERPAKDMISDVTYTDINHFARFLSQNISEPAQKQFVVEFFVDALSSFAFNDLYKDNVALAILENFIEKANLKISPGLYDNIIKLALLVSISCDEEGKVLAAKLLRIMVENINHPYGKDIFSYSKLEPGLVETTLKPIGHYSSVKKLMIDRKCLPTCRIFRTNQASLDVLPLLINNLKAKFNEK